MSGAFSVSLERVTLRHMAVFEYGGESIHYAQRGSGSRVVIFLHNLGSSRLIWEPAIAGLDDRFTAYALDFPGYGDSPLTTEPSIDRLVEILEGFVAEIGAERIDLVGNCVGSAVSLLFAERNPSTVGSMVLFNPATAATLAPTPLGVLARLAARNVFPHRLLRALTLPKPIADAIVWAQTGTGRVAASNAGTRERLRDLWTDKGRILPMAGIAAAVAVPFERIDRMSPDVFADINVQMIWGERNRVLSAKAGRELAHRLGIPYLGLPTAGHLAMLETPPEEIDDILRATLTP